MDPKIATKLLESYEQTHEAHVLDFISEHYKPDWDPPCLYLYSATLPADFFKVLLKYRDRFVIKELLLGENYLGDEGCKTLSEYLKANPAIEILTVCSNRIGIEGCKILADALQENKSLHTLTLDENLIDFEGIKALVVGLKDNKALKKLSLASNKFKKEEHTEIAEYFKTNNLSIQLRFGHYLGANVFDIKSEKEHDASKSPKSLCFEYPSSPGGTSDGISSDSSANVSSNTPGASIPSNTSDVSSDDNNSDKQSNRKKRKLI